MQLIDHLTHIHLIDNAIHVFIVIVSCLVAFRFHQTKNGNLRRALITFFLSLAWNCLVRAFGEFVCADWLLNNVVAAAPLCAALVWLAFEVDNYKKKNLTSE
jgi:hypothetical protein